MSLLSRILPPSNIILDILATSKKRAFEQAGLLFENNQGIARTAGFHSLISRERLGSTASGHQVAVPHGRITGLKAPIGAFMRLSEPIRFAISEGRTATPLKSTWIYWQKSPSSCLMAIYASNYNQKPIPRPSILCSHNLIFKA